MGLTLKTKSSSADSSPFNPYVAARREWDERYGEIITRAKNWRFIAILSAMATARGCSGNRGVVGPVQGSSLRRRNRFARKNRIGRPGRGDHDCR